MYFFHADKDVKEFIEEAVTKLRLTKVRVINDMIRHGHAEFWLQKEREITAKTAMIKNGKNKAVASTNNQQQQPQQRASR